MSGTELKMQRDGVIRKSGKLYFSLEGGKELEFSKVARLILKRFRANQCRQLEEEILNTKLTATQLQEFFLAEGWPLLNWTVNSTLATAPLGLLCKIFDKRTLQNIVVNPFASKFNILQRLLMADAGLLKMGFSEKPEEKHSQIEKFEILLQVAPKEVSQFMASKISSKDSSLVARTKANFEAALASSVDGQTEFAKASLATTPQSSEAKREAKVKVEVSSTPDPISAISLAPPIVSVPKPSVYAQQPEESNNTPPSPRSIRPAT